MLARLTNHCDMHAAFALFVSLVSGIEALTPPPGWVDGMCPETNPYVYNNGGGNANKCCKTKFTKGVFQGAGLWTGQASSGYAVHKGPYLERCLPATVEPLSTQGPSNGPAIACTTSQCSTQCSMTCELDAAVNCPTNIGATSERSPCVDFAEATTSPAGRASPFW